jgi:hypothetical protein
MQSVATAAAAAVERRRVEHGDGEMALRNLAAAADDLNAGIALAVLGEHEQARRRLTGQVHVAFRESAMGYLGLDREQAQERASEAVQDTRLALGLPTADRPTWDA